MDRAFAAAVHTQARSGATDPESIRIEAIRAVIRAHAGAIAAARGLDAPREWGAAPLRDDDLSAHTLGRAYERMLGSSVQLGGDGPSIARDPLRRRLLGAFYTPPSLAARLVDRALTPAKGDVLLTFARRPVLLHTPALGVRVLDPAVGAGVFLLEAVDQLAALAASFVPRRRPRGAYGDRLLNERRATIPGGDRLPDAQVIRLQVAESCVFGMDIDPFAVEVARLSLWIHAAVPGVPHTAFERCVRIGDALLDGSAAAWADVAPDGFTAVVGNPPFLNQLESATARSAPDNARLRESLGLETGAYTDTSGLFLLRALSLCGDDGRVCMIQPISLLSARDAAPVRRACIRRAHIESIWLDDGREFRDAAVRVCAPCLIPWPRPQWRSGALSGPEDSLVGAAECRAEDLLDGQAWAGIVAAATARRAAPPHGLSIVSDHAEATADFRDQYYGLRGMIVEDADISGRADIERRYPRLITTGLIDLARCLWGERTTRFDRRVWRAPRVDLVRLRAETDLGPWADARLVPKILLATQTRALEAVVDERGEWIPLVPIISIMPHHGVCPWMLAAAMTSPISSERARREHLGAALSVDAIKLSASQALRLECPPLDHPQAVRAGSLFREISGEAADGPARLDRLAALGRCACAALGIDALEAELLIADWLGRHTPRSRRPSAVRAP